jgi:hypothetical protein
MCDLTIFILAPATPHDQRVARNTAGMTSDEDT